jgi:ABC-type amino acid transport substrate-binding protein
VGHPSLVQAGVLIAAINPTVPPIQYVDKDGKIVGLDVDLGNEIARRLCLRMHFESLQFSTMTPGLQDGRFDMIDSLMYYTKQRASQVLMIPYGASTLAIVVPQSTTQRISGPEDFSGKKFAVELGTVDAQDVEKADKQLRDAGKPGIEVHTFNNYADVLQALRAAQVDGAFIGTEEAYYYQKQGVTFFRIALTGYDPHAEALTLRGDGLYGLAMVPNQLPGEAAREILRVARNPRFVGVVMAGNGLGKPFGHPVYHPIYTAAAECDLPVVLHAGGDATPDVITHTAGGGLPATYGEYEVLKAQPVATHLVNMIARGVFERFPGFRLLGAGAGCGWIPALFWRFDTNYKTFRREGAGAAPPAERGLVEQHPRRHVAARPPARPGGARPPHAGLRPGGRPALLRQRLSRPRDGYAGLRGRSAAGGLARQSVLRERRALLPMARARAGRTAAGARDELKRRRRAGREKGSCRTRGRASTRTSITTGRRKPICTNTCRRHGGTTCGCRAGPRRASADDDDLSPHRRHEQAHRHLPADGRRPGLGLRDAQAAAAGPLPHRGRGPDLQHRPQRGAAQLSISPPRCAGRRTNGPWTAGSTVGTSGSTARSSFRPRYPRTRRRRSGGRPATRG